MMRTILLIDDDPAVLDSLRVMLEQAGFSVLTATHAHDAMEVLEMARPDAVLTDIFMPHGDGFEAIKGIRGRHPGLPIIAMSGSEMDAKHGHLRIAMDLGAQAAVTKPFEPAKLIGLINSVIASEAAQEIGPGDHDGR